MPYEFLAGDAASPADVQRLIDMTLAGELQWRRYDESSALCVERSTGEGARSNLIVTSVYISPSTGEWSHLRLVTAHGARAFISSEARPDLAELIGDLYRLAGKAARLGGRLQSEGDEQRECEQCGQETPHRWLVDRPYGLAGAVMAGSERLVCVACERSTRISPQDA